MYSICKARNADPSSHELGTIDAAIFHDETASTFLYSIVIEHGGYVEFQAYPCLDPKVSRMTVPGSFEDLKALYESRVAELGTLMEMVCAEGVDLDSAKASLGEDLEGVPKEDREEIWRRFDECFGARKGGSRP